MIEHVIILDYLHDGDVSFSRQNEFWVHLNSMNSTSYEAFTSYEVFCNVETRVKHPLVHESRNKHSNHLHTNNKSISV